MDFQQVVEARRSMRKFDPEKKLTEAMISELVEAATFAPSWKNSQTARYYCIMSEEKLRRIKEEALPEFNAKNVHGAPALFVTTFVRNRSGYEKTGLPCNELGNRWGTYDLGLHNAYLVLKAKEMGLDTLIMGIRDEVKIREILKVPEEEIIVAVIGIGYGLLEPSMPARKKPEEILHFQ